MFWRFGGYANISTIDSVLDKPDVTLDEVLDESDLLQELKQHNTKLIEFLREDNTFQRLLDYVTSEPLTEPEDELEDEEDEVEDDAKEVKSSFSPVRSLSLGRSRTEKTKKQEEKEERQAQEKTRQKHAFVASEILSSEVWSITETLMESRESLVKFWSFIRKPPALDPVTAGYFTKINETLLDKKTEETLEFIKSQEGVIPAMLQHVDCPMIMDLLLKIISMEKAEGGQGIVDWLQSQNLMPTLLGYLDQQYPTFTQTSAGDFIKAIITISANASQNEQSCIGPNSLTRQLVSEACIKPLIANMLKGGNPLTVGVGIIIEVIRKNNSDYDPEVTAAQEITPSSGDPIYLGSLLRQFAIHVPEFMELILSSKHTVSTGDETVSVNRKQLPVAFGKTIEPLGFDRFKTCELMAELLHCSNMGLLNESGSEAYVRQRDLERERLRAEGKFSRAQEPPSATTEFSEDSIDHTGESPEFITRPSEFKKLDQANNMDEDGFEDVGGSGDLIDDIDFAGKSESARPLKPSKSRLSLDDEFFDEPLHSPPRSGSLDAIKTQSNGSRPSSGVVQSALTPGVDKLKLEEDETPESSKESPEISITDDLVAEIDAHLSPTKEKHDPSMGTNKESLHVAYASPSVQSPGNMSPHSEDTPAPLFSPQHNPSQQIEQTSGEQTTPTQSHDKSAIPWQQSTNDEWAPHIEHDLDGRPIVGDFLKMQFVEHQVVPTILNFFFRFPWNNFLHNVVYDVVQQVFNGTMERGYNRALAIDLFMTGKITERVIEGQLRSDEAQARNNLRLGYMGHLTLIAEEVVKFSERHPIEILSEPVLEKVTQRLWTDYVEHTLSETRERDNAILGGVRPDIAGGARQAVLEAVTNSTFSNAGSVALANAGLNGSAPGLDSMDLNNQTSGNFLASGSQSSGFGSSSDEEDEEMEEPSDGTELGTDQYSNAFPPNTSQPTPLLQNGSNDTGKDLENYSSSDDNGNPILTPSSASSSDASQPATESSSFLPPPLKISPSRARRQLAVRLALKEKERKEEKEKAEADGAEDDGNETKATSGIFSPTEGRTSTPDTPAFTTGAKIHERGLHAQRRAAAAAAAAASGNANSNNTGDTNDSITQLGDDITSPIRSDDGFSEEEDQSEDPWASLDAAAAKVVGESTSPNADPAKEQGESSWFGSSFLSQKQKPGAIPNLASNSASNNSLTKIQDKESIDADVNRSLGNDHQDTSSVAHSNAGTASNPEGHLEYRSMQAEDERLIIGLSPSIENAQPKGSLPGVAMKKTNTKDNAKAAGLTISASKAVPAASTSPPSNSPTSSSSPSTYTRPKSPKETNTRGAMSRLFQS